MNVCSCDWDGDYIGSCILGGGPRIARKPGHICCNCNGSVIPGQTCVDFAGLHSDESGWFNRMHVECFHLMELFSENVCGHKDGWATPFNLIEASEHAVSQSNNPFWENWLFLYEKTWRLSPEPPDPNTRRIQKWISIYNEQFIPGKGKLVAKKIWITEHI